MINDEIEKKYKDVQVVLEDALEKTKVIDILGEKENIELSEIRKTLEALNNKFQNEIEKLKNSSEWDKFCIAFFGETNAGKSTIIESLRIIYEEETRRLEAMSQKNEYHNLMVKHCDDYSELISSLEEVNTALKKQYGKNNKWLFYIVAGVVGVAIGLLLANLGIGIW